MNHSTIDGDPLVSVIIPTHNRINLLLRAIKSVLKQNYRKFELIIIDDGSIDDTSSLIAKFSDPRIKYIRFKENRGKSSVLNEGIKLSHGTYLAFLDDDDEFLPHTLKLEVNKIKNTPNDIGFVVGRGIFIKKETISFFNKTKKIEQQEALYNSQLRYNTIALCGTLIKRKCLDKVGFFNENLFFGIDWEFMLRLLKQYKYNYLYALVYKAHYEEPTNLFHITKKNRRNLFKRLNTYKFILINYFNEIIKSKKMLSKHFFRIALTLYSLDKFRLSNKYFFSAFHTNPRNLKYFFYYLNSKLKNRLNQLHKIISLLFQKIEDILYYFFSYYYYSK